MATRYEQAQAEEQARRVKVQEQQAKRRAELDYFQALEQQRADEQRQRDAEMAAFDQRVQASRGKSIDPVTMPTLDSVFQQKRAQEAAEAEAAEQARIAAIPPERLKRSTLPYAEQVRRNTWEAINGVPWPDE